MNAFSSLWRFVKHVLACTVSPGSSSTGTSTTLFDVTNKMRFRQFSLPRVHLFGRFCPLLGLSVTATHDLVNVVHLLELDILELVLITFVVVTFRR